jgi:hypothetical protein
MGDYAYSQEWVDASQSWNFARLVGRRWKAEAGDERNFVSLYAMTNPSEDFAETLTLYRINPAKLMDMNSTKYELIKNSMFFDQEFTEDLNCSSQPEFISDDSNEIKKSILFEVKNNYKHLKGKAKDKSSLLALLLSHYKNDYKTKLFLEHSENIDFLKNTKLSKRFR